MKPDEMSEEWVRRGTADDIVVLAKLFAYLAPEMRRRLLTSVAGGLSGQEVSAGRERGEQAPLACDGPLFDAINLMTSYAALPSDDKSALFASAIELVAATRLESTLVPVETLAGGDEWLGDLAADTYPDSGAVSELLRFAAGVDPRWQQEVFPDGQYPIASSTSENEIASADSMLTGYERIRWNADGMNKPPDAADHLGIVVARSNFTEWNGEAWVLDDDAWKAATRHAAVMVFAELVAEWRGRFFETLIAGPVRS